MKKYSFIMLILVLNLLFSACGRRKDVPQIPSTAPHTTPAATIPETEQPAETTMPTVETNIPDPTVNSNSTETESSNSDLNDPTNTTEASRNSVKP